MYRHLGLQGNQTAAITAIYNSKWRTVIKMVRYGCK